MSPHFYFRLDHTGFERRAELLKAAAMEFIETRRQVFPPLDVPPYWKSETLQLLGELHSTRGKNQCYFQSRGESYAFVVTIGRDPDILEDVEKAFAGHLLDDTKPQI